jgi:hypothetical protein
MSSNIIPLSEALLLLFLPPDKTATPSHQEEGFPALSRPSGSFSMSDHDKEEGQDIVQELIDADKKKEFGSDPPGVQSAITGAIASGSKKLGNVTSSDFLQRTFPALVKSELFNAWLRKLSQNKQEPVVALGATRLSPRARLKDSYGFPDFPSVARVSCACLNCFSCRSFKRFISCGFRAQSMFLSGGAPNSSGLM